MEAHHKSLFCFLFEGELSRHPEIQDTDKMFLGYCLGGCIWTTEAARVKGIPPPPPPPPPHSLYKQSYNHHGASSALLNG